MRLRHYSQRPSAAADACRLSQQGKTFPCSLRLPITNDPTCYALFIIRGGFAEVLTLKTSAGLRTASARPELNALVTSVAQ